ncbi:hypothetical protein [Halomonas sp. BC04]|uniref:hypothetical protein n=1 Tax=Halomonas sp. BC04 TaxID=1403540 RepID=UPI0003ED7BA1|nr:hypothetical protein [Halomonas sp. BC04]EWH01136.1 hypothetical protein Q427_15440 [Halomonas sp. BC04]
MGENVSLTQHPRILSARETLWEWPRLEDLLQRLRVATKTGDLQRIQQLLLEAPAAYHPQGPIVDLAWNELGKRPVLLPDCPTQDNLESQPSRKVEELLKAATAASLFKGPPC